MTLTIADLERPDPALRVPTDIEDLLVWTYRDQRADVVIRNGVGLYETEAQMDEALAEDLDAITSAEPHRSSTCGIAALQRIGRTGCRVDGGGMASDHLHEDAERIHRVIGGFSMPISALIIRNARSNDRPDWMPGVRPRPRPVMTPKGHPHLIYGAWDKNHNYGACLVEWSPSMARIDGARAEYELWWNALRSLAGLVRRDLVRFLATGPACSPAPWIATR